MEDFKTRRNARRVAAASRSERREAELRKRRAIAKRAARLKAAEAAKSEGDTPARRTAPSRQARTERPARPSARVAKAKAAKRQQLAANRVAALRRKAGEEVIDTLVETYSDLAGPTGTPVEVANEMAELLETSIDAIVDAVLDESDTAEEAEEAVEEFAFEANKRRQAKVTARRRALAKRRAAAKRRIEATKKADIQGGPHSTTSATDEAERKPDTVVDVEADAYNEDSEADAADRPTDVNDGGQDGSAVTTESLDALSSTAALLDVVSFVEDREQAGLSKRADRMKEIARFEKMPSEIFNAHRDAFSEFRQASKAPEAPVRKRVANTGRVPSLGRSASTGNDSDFLTFL